MTPKFNSIVGRAVLAGTAVALTPLLAAVAGNGTSRFVPVATYDVAGEAAEIVTTTPDGNLLIYTDAVGENIGFVDISDVSDPQEDLQPVDGGPTSVTVTTDGEKLEVTTFLR